MNTIYTAGYAGGWTPAQLKATCERLGALLLDIRYVPTSRRPEWRREALRTLLGAGGYQHEPALGNANYKSSAPIRLAAPERALSPVARTLAQRPVVLLCACRDWQTCHRAVAAAFLAERLGAPVEHLEPPAREDAPPAPGTMKALTLTAPWGTLVALLLKRYETRSWATSYRGRIAIHQGATLTPVHGWAGLREICARPPFAAALLSAGLTAERLRLGAVVATADLVAIHRTEDIRDRLTPLERAFGDYTSGRFAWELANVRPLAEPLPARGMQGLWTWAPQEGVVL